MFVFISLCAVVSQNRIFLLDEGVYLYILRAVDEKYLIIKYKNWAYHYWEVHTTTKQRAWFQKFF